jgi:hypothetical protein
MNHKEQSPASVLAEIKEEVKGFIETRLQLLRSETTEKLRTWKHWVPLLAVGLGLVLTSWFLLTITLVALIHAWFLPSAYSWVWAGLIVTAVYSVFGGVIGWFAFRRLSAAGLAPKRTIEVLKQDQVWVQNEARAA